MAYHRLTSWFITHLRKGCTLAETAGRIGSEFPDDPKIRASVETFYAWIHDPTQQHRALRQYLPYGHKKRRRKRGRNEHQERAKWRTSTHDRPGVVEDRRQFEHWESKSVIWAGGSIGIHTTVERTSRYLQAVKIPHIAARPTVEAQIELYSAFPSHAVLSVIADNGPQFAFHFDLADALAVPPYFADPYSAYQRASSEHFNGRLRRYLPTGTSFDDLTQQGLDEFVREINNRPRKILSWATLAEVFPELAWELVPTT